MEKETSSHEPAQHTDSPAPAKIKHNPRSAFNFGWQAKRNGWDRLSPYYKDEAADFFFYAGFDGIDWKQTTEKWNERCLVIA